MHRNRRIAISAVVVGSLVPAAIGAVPAVASPGSYARLAPGQLGVASAATPLVNNVSHSFAGWVFQKTGSTSVTSVFKVPTIKCTTATTGVSPGSFMLTGVPGKLHFNGAGVIFVCSNGQPGAAANTIIDLNETFDSTHSVSVGDLIKATVTTSATKTTATVSDLTHRFTYTNSGTGNPAAEERIIDDSVVSSNPSGVQYPVLNFGEISYTSGAIGGKALGLVTPRGPFDMRTTANVLQIQTGALGGPTKNLFNTFFRHA